MKTVPCNLSSFLNVIKCLRREIRYSDTLWSSSISFLLLSFFLSFLNFYPCVCVSLLSFFPLSFFLFFSFFNFCPCVCVTLLSFIRPFLSFFLFFFSLCLTFALVSVFLYCLSFLPLTFLSFYPCLSSLFYFISFVILFCVFLIVMSLVLCISTSFGCFCTRKLVEIFYSALLLHLFLPLLLFNCFSSIFI